MNNHHRNQAPFYLPNLLLSKSNYELLCALLLLVESKTSEPHEPQVIKE